MMLSHLRVSFTVNEAVLHLIKLAIPRRPAANLRLQMIKCGANSLE